MYMHTHKVGVLTCKVIRMCLVRQWTSFSTRNNELFSMQQRGLKALPLSKEGLTYSPKSASLLRKLRRGESILRKPSTGRASKVAQRVKDVIEEKM